MTAAGFPIRNQKSLKEKTRIEEKVRATDIQTQPLAPQADTWISCPHGDTRGTRSAACPSPPRTPQIDPISHEKADSYKFPRAARLTSSKEFTRVFEKGRRYRGEKISISIHPNDLGHPRLGLVVGRKAGKAHQRNRYKRVLRETFRLELLPKKKSTDLVVRIHPGRERITSQELRDEFLAEADRMGLLTTGTERLAPQTEIRHPNSERSHPGSEKEN